MSWKVISTITHLSTDATYSDFRASKRIDHLTVNAAKHVHVDCHLTVFFYGQRGRRSPPDLFDYNGPERPHNVQKHRGGYNLT
jgi:hypothetical protein